MGVVAATVLSVPAVALAADMAGWPASLLPGAARPPLGRSRRRLVSTHGNYEQPSMLTEVSLMWRTGFMMHLLQSCILFAR